MDLSGANGSEPLETVRGFSSLAHANAFARRYVRDSMEVCRPRGGDAEAAREAWFAFGEDAVVGGPEGKTIEGAWSSGSELAEFAAQPPRDREDRNWRIIDPRKLADEEDGQDEPEEGDEA
ncbi:hypothetical protein KHU32_01590 [Roseococcus sp. XZZS9]|uniref:Uncharacterized protein n=2 Tax=Roseococcus pinisoli TaxID=2835040 RepID=A0ABS5Q7K6_9PROT|nr:hypothetical protein [Roseococcus pinisoli]